MWWGTDMERVPSDPQALLAHADFVRALARTLVRDAARADDLEQETWLAALEHPPRSAQAPRGWLLTVLRNLARRFARGEARRARWEGEAGRPEPVPSTDEIVAREETRRRVVEAVLALEEPYRSAVVLRFYEDLPPRAIARRLGVPIETARTRVKRGLAHLRTRLDREWGGDRSAWCAALAPIALKRSGIVPAVLGGVAMKSTTKAAIAAALVLGSAVTLWPEGPPVAPIVAGGPISPAGPVATEGVRLAVAATGEEQQESPTVAGTGSGERRAVGAGGPRATGLVLDREGRAVAGARVFSYPESLGRAVRLAPDPESDPVQRAETDARGRFEVPLAGRSTYFSLVVDAEGFSMKALTSLRVGEDRKVVLDPAGALSGTVADREGRPVANARVRWLGLLGTATVERDSVSRSDGSYRIEGVPTSRATEGTGAGLA
ncbi:MAG: sigma-70 family RNA polymerase sigma factor, partial [Planctomycetota bacterium]